MEGSVERDRGFSRDRLLEVVALAGSAQIAVRGAAARPRVADELQGPAKIGVTEFAWGIEALGLERDLCPQIDAVGEQFRLTSADKEARSDSPSGSGGAGGRVEPGSESLEEFESRQRRFGAR